MPAEIKITLEQLKESIQRWRDNEGGNGWFLGDFIERDLFAPKPMEVWLAFDGDRLLDFGFGDRQPMIIRYSGTPPVGSRFRKFREVIDGK